MAEFQNSNVRHVVVISWHEYEEICNILFAHNNLNVALLLNLNNEEGQEICLIFNLLVTFNERQRITIREVFLSLVDP